jgi:hypothetical protein
MQKASQKTSSHISRTAKNSKKILANPNTNDHLSATIVWSSLIVLFFIFYFEILVMTTKDLANKQLLLTNFSQQKYMIFVTDF